MFDFILNNTNNIVTTVLVITCLLSVFDNYKLKKAYEKSIDEYTKQLNFNEMLSTRNKLAIEISFLGVEVYLNGKKELKYDFMLHLQKFRRSKNDLLDAIKDLKF